MLDGEGEILPKAIDRTCSGEQMGIAGNLSQLDIPFDLAFFPYPPNGGGENGPNLSSCQMAVVI